MKIVAANAGTTACYVSVNNVSVFGFTQNCIASAISYSGLYPVKKGDVISTFGWVNIKTGSGGSEVRLYGLRS